MLLYDLGDAAQRGANEIGAWIPNLVGALAVLAIGYLLARGVEGVVWRGLHRIGLDRFVSRGIAGGLVGRVTSSPSRLVGQVTFWAVSIAVFSLAVSVLGIGALEDLVASVYSYLPNVLAALLIFVVASALAAMLAALARRLMGDTSLGGIVAVVAPILVMTIAAFMILDELQVARTIVTITYAGLVGALALGSALAFGLGGRDVAARLLEGAYAAGEARRDEFRRDLDTGISRARGDADQSPAEEEPEPDATTTRRMRRKS